MCRCLCEACTSSRILPSSNLGWPVGLTRQTLARVDASAVINDGLQSSCARLWHGPGSMTGWCHSLAIVLLFSPCLAMRRWGPLVLGCDRLVGRVSPPQEQEPMPCLHYLLISLQHCSFCLKLLHELCCMLFGRQSFPAGPVKSHAIDARILVPMARLFKGGQQVSALQHPPVSQKFASCEKWQTASDLVHDLWAQLLSRRTGLGAVWQLAWLRTC